MLGETWPVIAHWTCAPAGVAEECTRAPVTDSKSNSADQDVRVVDCDRPFYLCGICNLSVFNN